MRFPRVSIVGMMAVVLVSAVALAALQSRDPAWAALTFDLALVLLASAPVIAWARKDEGRVAWAGFAAAGWARLLVWWATWDASPSMSVAPQSTLLWIIRTRIHPLPSGPAWRNVHDYLLTANYVEVILSGLAGAAVCWLAAGGGRSTPTHPAGIPDPRSRDRDERRGPSAGPET